MSSSNSPVAGIEVLVVIPALNEAQDIEPCINSLLKADERINSVQFVVADGGSGDGTQDIVLNLAKQHPNIQLMHNPGKLQSAGVNLAVRQFGQDYNILVRCDAHSVYPENYVLDVADSIRKRDVASVATPMDAIGDTMFQTANAMIVDTPLGSGGSAHRGGKVSQFVDHGHHAGFDLEWFRKVGGYDETFSHNEDAEYDHRLGLAGGQVFLDADIRIQYFPRKTVKALAKQYYNYGKGRARNMRKHQSKPRPRQMIPPAVLAVCVIAILLAPVFPWTLIVPAGYVSALLAVSLGLAFKTKTLAALMTGLASGTMHMAWGAGFIRQYFFGKPEGAMLHTPIMH